MNKNTMIIGGIIIVGAAIGAYATMNRSDDRTMMDDRMTVPSTTNHSGQTMMKDSTSTMMSAQDSVMQK